MGAIVTVTSAIQAALGIIGAFKGNATVAKVTGQVQDAISVVTALTPLVQQFADGQEVTLDDAKAALEDMNASLDLLEAEIAKQEAEEAEKK